MLIFYGYEFWTVVTPLLTPWWPQRLARLKRVFK